MTDETEAENKAEPVELVIPKAFVARVTTNLKTPGDEPRSFVLGPLTLLVGPSGSGKTSLVDAIGLALVGESPTRGLGKAATNLKRALPANAEALRANIELSTDEAISWGLGRADGKPVWSCADGFAIPSVSLLLPTPGVMLSVSSALDLLLGYDKSRLLALLDAVPSTEISVTGIAPLVRDMDRELSVRLEGMLPEEGTTISPAQLRVVVKAVDTITSEFTKALAACEAFSLGAGLSNAEEIELAASEQAFSLQAGAEFIRRETARCEKQLAAAETEIAETRKLVEASVPGYFQGREVVDRTVGLLRSTVARLEARSALSGRCPGCGGDHSLSQFEARIEQFEAALGQGAVAIQGHLDQLAVNATKRDRLVTSLVVLSELLTAYGAGEAFHPARLVELRHRKGEAALSIAAGSRAAVLARCKKTLGAVEGALLESAGRAAPEAAEIVRRRANRVLPRGREMRIACDGTRVHIGQSLNKGPIVPCGALSGSERIILAAAFALALQAKRAAPVSLLVLDEMMVDRKTLKLVLTGLSKAFDSDAGPTQIIVCAAEWSGKAPAGWIVREVVEESQEDRIEEKPATEQTPEQVTEIAGSAAEAIETAATPPETAGNETKPPENTGDTPAAGGFLDDLL